METTCNLPRDDKTVGRNDKAMFILNFNDPAALIQKISNYDYLHVKSKCSRCTSSGDI